LAEEGEEMTEKKERKSYNLHLRLANSFDYKQFMGVRTLQHLCRCSIRTALFHFFIMTRVYATDSI
jgi:hypothetical protein